MSRIKVEGTTPPEVLEAVENKAREARVPGHYAEFSLEEAAWVGAYPDRALSEQDVLDSADDLSNAVI